MERIKTYRVGEIARIARISVRTLRHYDDLGLLKPAMREASGYRVYDNDSLLRLQQILIHRELGFSLDEIAGLLDSPEFDIAFALKRQRAKLEEREAQTRKMIDAIDRTLDALSGNRRNVSMAQIFDGFDPKFYEAEAEERWGETAYWRESRKRATTLMPDDLNKANAESCEILERMAQLETEGANPDDPQVQHQVDRYHAHISRWYYSCERSHLRNLAQLYEDDPRFAATFDAVSPGLANYVIRAFRVG